MYLLKFKLYLTEYKFDRSQCAYIERLHKMYIYYN